MSDSEVGQELKYVNTLTVCAPAPNLNSFKRVDKKSDEYHIGYCSEDESV